jgi:hypothetical protein
MKLSIIIVNWQTKGYLNKCLTSIFQNPLSSGEMEIIVVDNASTDQSSTLVAQQFPQVILIANQKNLGFAKAVNQGIKQAQGDYCLLLNPDTLILSETLNQTVATMEQHPNYGILGCQINNPDNSLQKSVRRLPKAWSQTAILLKLHVLFPGLLKQYLCLDFNYQKSQSVEQVMGAFFLINRRALQAIGPLNEQFFTWFEEVEYCRRAKQNNWVIWYQAESKIIHYGGQSFGQLPNVKKQQIYNHSLLRYWLITKNYPGLALTLIFWLPSLLAQGIIQFLHLKKNVYQSF